MFRLFLRNKILSGEPEPKSSRDRPPQEREPAQGGGRQRNRRIFERYSIEDKHLTLMNDQDILVVQEISAKGFSTSVSKRATERLQLNDVYEARVRYLGEVYDLQAKVTWKKENQVGFEIVEAVKETLMFLKRLLHPFQIAGSMQLMEASFMHEQPDGNIWYHGDEESDLYIWVNLDTSNVLAWQFNIGNRYAEWNPKDGISTGTLVEQTASDNFLGQPQSQTLKPDELSDNTYRQLVTDIFVALEIPERDRLLQTVTS